jgi:hypothetical protein
LKDPPLTAPRLGRRHLGRRRPLRPPQPEAAAGLAAAAHRARRS